MLPNFASLPRYGTRASRAAATRSLGPDDSLAHCVPSLRVAGPRGAPRDAKEAGAKVYPLVSFPVRTRRPARVLAGVLAPPTRPKTPPRRPAPDLRQRWAAPLNRAAWTPRAATDSRSVTTTTRRHRRVAHSCPDGWLPGRLAACRARSCTEVWTARRHGGRDGHASTGGNDEPHHVTTHRITRVSDHRRDADDAADEYRSL